MPWRHIEGLRLGVRAKASNTSSNPVLARDANVVKILPLQLFTVTRGGRDYA